MKRLALTIALLFWATAGFAQTQATSYIQLSPTPNYLANGGPGFVQIDANGHPFIAQAIPGSGTVTNAASLANNAMAVGDGGGAGIKTVGGSIGGSFTTAGAFATTGAASGVTFALPAGGPFTFTYPLASQTLASLAGTETFTNKTYSGGVFGGTFSGNFTLSGIPTLSGLSVGAQVACLGLSATNQMVLLGAGCGAGGGSVSLTAGTAGVVMSPNPITGTGTISLAGRTAVADANCGTLTASGTSLVAFTTVLTAARSCTLPAASAMQAGQRLCFVDEGDGTNPAINGANTVTLNRAGSDKIVGTTSLVMGVGYAATCLEADGSSKWGVVGNQNLGSQAATANNFLTGLGSDGIFTRAQPSVSNISGFGTGVATWLGTPSSANLASALTDETGTGAAVFAVSPALTGTPTAPTASVGTNTTQVATTAFVIANAGGGSGAVTKVSTLTANNTATTLTWTGLTGDDYDIRCRHLVPATSGTAIMLQMSHSGTFNTTNEYGDYINYGQIDAAVSATSGASHGSAAGITVAGDPDATTGVPILIIHIVGLTTAAGHDVAFQATDFGVGAAHNFSFTGGGRNTTATAVDGLRLITGSGNLKTGSCTLYAVAN
jgi:hypothetical protein